MGDTAVKDGILDESVPGEDTGMKNFSYIDFSNDVAQEMEYEGTERFQPGAQGEEHEDDRIFTFCHDAWRQKILSYLLESHKRDIHEHATLVLESNFPDIDERDYRTRLKLFHHMKQCGNGRILEAAELAINIGRSLSQEGMISQSILLQNEALDMWRSHKSKSDNNDNSSSVIMSQEVIESIDQSHLTSVIKPLTAVAGLSFKIE